MLELLNQLDGFDSLHDVKVCWAVVQVVCEWKKGCWHRCVCLLLVVCVSVLKGGTVCSQGLVVGWEMQQQVPGPPPSSHPAFQ